MKSPSPTVFNPHSAPLRNPVPPSHFSRALEFLAAPVRAAQQEQRAWLLSPAGDKFDSRTALVLVATALLLTVRHYCFSRDDFTSVEPYLLGLLEKSAREVAQSWLANSKNHQLAELVYWACGQVVVYVVVPVAIVRLVFREPLANFGASFRGCLAGWRLYALMFFCMVPAVCLAARGESFLHTYPFYRLARGEPLWPRFLIWEFAYAVQFVALEFFFRGFVLLGARRGCGAYAIFVMMVPYCMIHFSKPWLETLGAVAAGIILGFMSLKTGRIWLGALLHIGVAFTMDACALLART